MQTLLRVLVLAAFAAAGVGLAVSLAYHADLAHVIAGVEHALPWSQSPAAPKEVPPPESVSAASLPTPALPPGNAPAEPELAPQPDPAFLPTSAPDPAPWRPPVAEPTMAELRDLLERVSEQANVLDAARRAMVPAGPPQLAPPALAHQVSAQVPVTPSEPPNHGSLPPPTPTAPINPINTITREQNNRYTIFVREADIREVLESIDRWENFNFITTPSVHGLVSATLHNVDLSTALDVLLRNAGLAMHREGDVAYVGKPEELQAMSLARQKVSIRVYRPNYVTAAELQKLITPLLSPAGQANVSVSGITTSSETQQGISASSDQTGGDDFAGNEVLLVRDYESVLHYVEQVIQEVDRKPLQVSLEAMILSVRLNDENERGVNLELLRNENNSRLISGIPLTNLAAVNLSDGGLKFAFLDSSISAFITALETVGDTNVIASPRLMCLNKQRAEILIGSQLGYVNTTVTETTATQSVSFLEVGTQLRFRPFIANDGTIRLEVHPELSTGNVRIEQGLTLPDKEVTQVTTNIMCRDGRTIIIGGLIREDLSSTVAQIPLLGNMPYVGALFRQKTEKTERREIIVLITPRLVREQWEAFEGEQTKFEFLARQENYADKMSFIGKRHYGLRYLRLARAAWNAGDAPVALRYVNLALHFDPQNLEATTLRRDIMQTAPPEVDNVHDHLNQGLFPLTLPAYDYSREGVEWRTTRPPADMAPPPDAIEFSEPGPKIELIPFPGR